MRRLPSGHHLVFGDNAAICEEAPGSPRIDFVDTSAGRFPRLRASYLMAIREMASFCEEVKGTPYHAPNCQHLRARETHWEMWGPGAVCVEVTYLPEESP